VATLLHLDLNKNQKLGKIFLFFHTPYKGNLIFLIKQISISSRRYIIVVYLTSSCVNWAFLASLKCESNERFKGPECQKSPIYNERNVFKVSLTFRFDKLLHLSKSVHTGENSQILTVSNKKIKIFHLSCIGCSFKFILKVGLEELIVNAPLFSVQSKNTNNAKVRLDLNS
jgi:hypothetical protein